MHPLVGTCSHVDAWVDHLARTPSARTRRPLSPASIARRLSALSKFYAYALSLGVLDRSPLDQVERPEVSDESSTAGLTAAELVSLLDAADAHSPRAAALISVLLFTGCRISESLGPTSLTTATTAATASCASAARAACVPPSPSPGHRPCTRRPDR